MSTESESIVQSRASSLWNFSGPFHTVLLGIVQAVSSMDKYSIPTPASLRLTDFHAQPLGMPQKRLS